MAGTKAFKPRMSDEAVESKTGKTWSRWFKHLDAAGGKKMTHQEIAAHLRDKHDVRPWWTQMVAVTYEQARGLREVHEKPSGYEISVSRTVDAPLSKAFKAWTDDKTRKKFCKSGWRFRSPHDLSVNYWDYRDYIRRSKAEFTVAKDQYVRLNTGWFSDRSACYLAAGRPVITQETGFTKLYGDRGGLFGFKKLSEVSEAVREINADYRHHSRVARALAKEIFEAEKVIKSLLDRAGL